MEIKSMRRAVIAAIIALVLAMAAGCAGNGAGGPAGGDGKNGSQPGGEPAELTSDTIESFYFYYPSGSMPDSSYEIVKEDNQFILKINNFEWYGGTDVSMYTEEYEIDEKTLGDLQDIVVSYNITGWNGFDEEAGELTSANNRFMLEIVYDDQSVISARGDHAFPDGYKEAEKALLDFFGNILQQKQQEAMEGEAEAGQKEKEEMIKDVSNIRTLIVSRGNFLNENIPRYEINSTDEGLELTFGEFDYSAVYAKVLLSGAGEQEILSICKKHDVFSWDGFDEEIDGSSDFVSANCLFLDSRGRAFNIAVFGVGAEPEGWAAFYDEVTEYLDSILGVNSVTSPRSPSV